MRSETRVKQTQGHCLQLNPNALSSLNVKSGACAAGPGDDKWGGGAGSDTEAVK
jgi:hypothetical protein